MLDKLKALLQSRREEPEETELIYVYLPEALEPDERCARYADPIDAELRLHGIGYVSGGGTLLSDEKPDGSRDIIHCGIDVDAGDVDAARSLLREELRSLGCPPGTQLQYGEGATARQDEFDGRTWRLAQPRTGFHPGFGT